MKIIIEHDGMRMEIPAEQVEVFQMSTPTAEPRLILDALLTDFPKWEAVDGD